MKNERNRPRRNKETKGGKKRKNNIERHPFQRILPQSCITVAKALIRSPICWRKQEEKEENNDS